MQLYITLPCSFGAFIALFLNAPTLPLLEHNCPDATKYTVQLCLDEGQNPYWTGLWDECFNLATQTSWTPELGIIEIRSKWRLCQYGFHWSDVQYQCEVPSYTWTVSPEFDYWVATIAFPPDECLAEVVPNCYDLTIYGTGCPF